MKKTNKVTCVPSKDSDQPGHPPSLIRVFAVCMRKVWVVSYPLSAQRRLWSDWVDAQADLSLRWVHSHFVGFVIRRLILAHVAVNRNEGDVDDKQKSSKNNGVIHNCTTTSLLLRKHSNKWATSWQMICAPSEDSDQPGHPPCLISLRCVLNEYLRNQAFFMRTAKTLIRPGKCPGWSKSSLGAHVILLVLLCCSSNIYKVFLTVTSSGKGPAPFRWLPVHDVVQGQQVTKVKR